MAVHVLIVTPSPGFGELIRQVFDESDGYSTALASSGPATLNAANTDPPDLCILDADLDDFPKVELVETLRLVNSKMLLVLIPPEDDEERQEIANLAQLDADGQLERPFYLPNLLETVEMVLKEKNVELFDRKPVKKASAEARKKQTSKKVKTAPAPQWLQDVSLAAQHLTRLSLESASQAALITRGDQIWAYAGELPQPAAEELARTVASYWTDESSDLARFIRLDETESEYMMYATSLGGEFVLALVFDATTPFSKIRAQAGKLARSLASEPQVNDTSPNETTSEQVFISDPEISDPEIIVPEQSDPEIEDRPASTAEPIFEDVPPSIPGDWVPGTTPSPARQSFLEELLADGVTEYATPAEEIKDVEVALEMSDRNQENEEQTEVYVDLDETRIATPDYAVETIPHQVEQAAGQDEETVPSREQKGERQIALEPVSPALYNLTYSCVLIPRFPEHHLTGNLAARLSDWITQLCLAFGWRLEHLSIRPDYVQWIVNVPPTSSPGHLMRIIRQHSSRRLFVEFPSYQEDNPSGDFWAPGYFIMNGDQPTPANLIKGFIQQTRERQGITSKK
ncbi:MAG: IS200/IS605 family transposase [Chloroflexi bacterium]|nr:IS200/IS605 family transposase [Chloroflexota bacterium]